MTRIAQAILVKIPVKMYQFTIIPMNDLNGSSMLLNFSQCRLTSSILFATQQITQEFERRNIGSGQLRVSGAIGGSVDWGVFRIKITETKARIWYRNQEGVIDKGAFRIKITEDDGRIWYQNQEGSIDRGAFRIEISETYARI